MRLGRLGQQHDVRAVLGRAERIASPMPRLPPETTSVRSVKVDMGLLNARANAVLGCYRIGSRILILGK
jgi:hypothetical protein